MVGVVTVVPGVTATVVVPAAMVVDASLAGGAGTVVLVVLVVDEVDDVGPACTGAMVEGTAGTVSATVPPGGVPTPVMGGPPTGTGIGTVCVRTKADALSEERALVPVANTTKTAIPLIDAPSDNDMNRVVGKLRTPYDPTPTAPLSAIHAERRSGQ